MIKKRNQKENKEGKKGEEREGRRNKERKGRMRQVDNRNTKLLER